MTQRGRNAMCDHDSYAKLRDRVEALEKNHIRFEEQLHTLFKSTQTMFRVVLVFAFILLLAVVYGALGQRGFTAVTNAAHGMAAKN